MKRTLLMERVADQTRLAVIEDGRLCELRLRRAQDENITGNIYLGRVENVLPGMNAAFVNIGLEKNAFLAADDVRAEFRDDRRLADSIRGGRIEKMVRPGQDALVQVTKAAVGEKGPRVSSWVTLPGRGLVLTPGARFVGVSRKIADERERSRLREIAGELVASGNDGVIVRTSAEGASAEALRAEYEALLKLWRSLYVRAEHGVAPRLICDDGDLATHAVRDWLNGDTEALWADGDGLYEELVGRVAALAPQYAEKIKRHGGEIPLFDIYRVDDQLASALKRQVWLDNGGTLVIDETEALTVIDVNTGKFTGKKDLEETVFRMNCDAAREIMRLLRLRDIGGIVIVDFIDMAAGERNEALLRLMREEAAKDANHVDIVGMTDLGLVELTRKKARQPLNRQLTRACPVCAGRGLVETHETVARRIQRDIWRRRRGGDGGALLIEAAEGSAEALLALGAPCAGKTWVCAARDLRAGEYRLSAADEARLPGGAKILK